MWATKRVRLAVAVAVAVTASVIVGCGGGEADTGTAADGAPVHAGPTTTSAGVVAPVTEPGPPVTASGDAPPAGPETTTPPAVDPDTAATPVVPAAGAYTFRTTGQRDGASVDADDVQTITHLDDDSIRLVSPGGEQTVELDFGATEVLLRSLRIDAGGGAFRRQFDPATPPVSRYVAPAASQQWAWEVTSNDGRTTIHQDTIVSGTEQIEALGQSYVAYVHVATITFSGDLSGSATVTAWLVPELGTYVRLDEVRDVALGALRMRQDTTSTLVSFAPG